ncbi:MAG: hypothetical protein ACHP7N_13530 [Caulobacterales bacterium]
MRWVLVSCAIALALAGCGKPAANSVSADNSAAPAAPTGPTVKVAVTLTPAAASALTAAGQNLIISLDLLGDANAKGLALQDEQGEFYLTHQVRSTLPGAGTATIAVPAFDPGLLVNLKGGKAFMMINVVSGEGHIAENKLYCSTYFDKIAHAEAAGVQIQCKPLS